MLTPREQLVLDCVKADPTASQQRIAEKLGMSRAAVAVHISNLGSKGVIRGRGYVIDEQPYVAAIGGANIDITGKPEGALRHDDSNPGSIHIAPGGVARNVAENLTRLGLPCRLISIVGDDRHGNMLLEQCRDRGLSIDDIVRESGATTSTYIAIMNERGELEAGISSMGILERLDAAALKRRHSTIEHARALFVDANLGQAALGYLFDEFADRCIAADPVSSEKAISLKPHLANIDILKPSLAEAAALLGKTRARHRDAPALARGLRELGVGEVYLSLGAKGVYVASNDDEQLIPASTTNEHRDVSGAGDAMTAAVLCARLDDHGPLEAAGFGLAAASIVLSAPGASSAGLSQTSLKKHYEQSFGSAIRSA